MMDLSLANILTMFPHTSRGFIEGEAVFKAQHIIFSGTLKKLESKMEIIALCLKSSALKDVPHEIRIWLEVKNNELQINCQCSCTAGAGGKCKHVCGTLLHIYKLGISKLEAVSQTQVTQSWGKVKTKAEALYPDTKVQDLCCVKNLEAPYPPSDHTLTDMEIDNLVEEFLIDGNPGSELYLHKTGRRDAETVDDTDFIQRKSLAVALANLTLSDLRKSPIVVSLTATALQFFQDNVKINASKAAEICLYQQGSGEWASARRLRITASNIYGLFTYRNNRAPNWRKKYEDTFVNRFKGNAATLYGLKWEPVARGVLEQEIGVKVAEVGLVVNPELSWLGCSPDGIIWPSHVVEIKCPLLGKKETAKSLVTKLKFIKNGALKTAHPYYGQCQVQMLLTGSRACYFVIFSSFDSTIEKIEVLFDEEFVNILVQECSQIYFEKILPLLRL